MDVVRSTKALVVSSLGVALCLYALYRKGSGTSSFIETAETLGRRINKGKKDEDSEYDVVIVGGGTSGCVIAARLSENPNVRVLLLEAGGSSRDIEAVNMPSGYLSLIGTPVDYQFFTEPQGNAGDVKISWTRAKLLGGCTTVNAQIFHNCEPSDYDEWALSGEKGSREWSYNEFHKYFLKFETFVPHPKYPAINTSLRGHSGPVKVGYFGYLHSICTQWIDACVNLGIPYKSDVNTPAGSLGVAKVMTYNDSRGRRVTAENAYLTPAVLKRRNLRVACHAYVTRILFETYAGTTKAVGVEFATSKDSVRYRVRARQEVVLSAGAVQSPQILMLSGVGPKEHLAEHKIPLVHDLPGVGQRLQDHIAVPLQFQVKKGFSMVNPQFRRGIGMLKLYIDWCRWKISGFGPLGSNLAEVAAFMRADDPKLFPPDSYDLKDETSGPNASDLEIVLLPLIFTPHPDLNAVTMIGLLLRPQSCGTITLQSADPFDAPVIDPRYLEKYNDVGTLVRCVRLMMRTAQSEPFASSLVPTDDPRVDNNLHRLNDAELEYEVRKRVGTAYHPTSTCRMARLEDGGVVDPYLRVHGIKSLRVADASVFPRVPAGHTTAPCLAVGEKAADIIKKSLSGA